MKGRESFTLLGGAAARPAGRVHRTAGPFLAPLRSTVFGDMSTAFQDGQQHRKVRGLLANDGCDAREIRIYKFIQRPEDA